MTNWITPPPQYQEKIMYKRVYQFLEKTGQIFPSQYGFRTSHSCENAVSELLSTIIKGKEQGLYTVSLFLDLSKAFDSLEHEMMLRKLESYGICGNVLQWFRSYLSERQIGTKCHVSSSGQIEYSDYKPIKFGTPQGSCLVSGYHADTPITIKAEPSIWPTAAFINIHEHPL